MAKAYTYDDEALREDLLDIITDISPKETQLMTGLAPSVAKSIRHEWLVDALKAVADNAHVEGADASYPDRTDPTRDINYCQILRVGFDVTDTERDVNTAGFSDRYAYEASKAMKEWKNDAEYALMRGSLSCGNNSTSRQLKGIKNFIATNTTNQSGVSLSESIFEDYLGLVWDCGAAVDEVYVGKTMKKRINGFTAGATKNVDIEDRRLVAAVDVYESSFAPLVKLFLHRYVNVAADSYYGIVGIDAQYWKVAHLRKPKVRELAKTGDSTKGEIVGEMTLECLADDAGFWGLWHK